MDRSCGCWPLDSRRGGTSIQPSLGYFVGVVKRLWRSQIGPVTGGRSPGRGLNPRPLPCQRRPRSRSPEEATAALVSRLDAAYDRLSSTLGFRAIVDDKATITVDAVSVSWRLGIGAETASGALQLTVSDERTSMTCSTSPAGPFPRASIRRGGATGSPKRASTPSGRSWRPLRCAPRPASSRTSREQLRRSPSGG